MGLGGYLTWTAVGRELKCHLPEDVKLFPIELHQNLITPIFSEAFKNNLDFYQGSERNSDIFRLFPLVLNNPNTNYCLQDYPDKVIHRSDKHVIRHICSFYGLDDVDLRCYLYFTESESKKVNNIIADIDKPFIVIEPVSKTNYTVNRVYPFDKWQHIVDNISNDVTVVQVGKLGSRLLKNVVDFTGQTTFREASYLIGQSKLLISSEGGLTHAATAVNTKSIVIITGYQSVDMVGYPQNINIDISSHGPCGMKIPCQSCIEDANRHNPDEIVSHIRELLD